MTVLTVAGQDVYPVKKHLVPAFVDKPHPIQSHSVHVRSLLLAKFHLHLASAMALLDLRLHLRQLFLQIHKLQQDN